MKKYFVILVILFLFLPVAAYSTDGNKSISSRQPETYVTYKQMIEWNKQDAEKRSSDFKWLVGIIISVGVASAGWITVWINRKERKTLNTMLPILQEINSKVGSEKAGALIDHHSSHGQKYAKVG